MAHQGLDDGATPSRLCPHQVGSSHLVCGRDRQIERRRNAYQASSPGHRQRLHRQSRREARAPTRQGQGTRYPRKCRQVRPAGSEWAKALRSWHHVPPLLYSLLRASRSEFGSFFRSSFRRTDCDKPSAEFLPCPLPYEWVQPMRPKGSRRRQHRFCERRAFEVMVNLQVCALNFIFLGVPPCVLLGVAEGGSCG